jgi:hypothetical protein
MILYARCRSKENHEIGLSDATANHEKLRQVTCKPLAHRIGSMSQRGNTGAASASRVAFDTTGAASWVASHSIQIDTPLANVREMFDAHKRYLRY